MDEASQLIQQGARRAERPRWTKSRADMQLRPEGQRLRVNCDFPLSARNGGQPLAAGFGVPQPRGQRRGLFGRTRHLHPPAFGQLAEAVHGLQFADNGIGVERRTPARTSSNASTASTRGVRASWAARDWGLRSSKTPLMIHGGTITVRELANAADWNSSSPCSNTVTNSS